MKRREWLINLRKSKGISQRQASSALGISQQYLCMIESGQRQETLSLEIAQKISKIFCVSLEEILRKEKERY